MNNTDQATDRAMRTTPTPIVALCEPQTLAVTSVEPQQSPNILQPQSSSELPLEQQEDVPATVSQQKLLAAITDRLQGPVSVPSLDPSSEVPLLSTEYSATPIIDPSQLELLFEPALTSSDPAISGPFTLTDSECENVTAKLQQHGGFALSVNPGELYAPDDLFTPVLPRPATSPTSPVAPVYKHALPSLPSVIAQGAAAFHTARSESPDESGKRLPPIMLVEKQQVTSHATKFASSSRRISDANFTCPVPDCGSTFTRRFNLRGHLRSHTEERPYLCEYDGCDKRFARQHDCRRHQTLHVTKQIEVNVCPGCMRPFSRLDALNRHLKSDAAVRCKALADLLVKGLPPIDFSKFKKKGGGGGRKRKPRIGTSQLTPAMVNDGSDIEGVLMDDDSPPAEAGTTSHVIPPPVFAMDSDILG